MANTPEFEIPEGFVVINSKLHVVGMPEETTLGVRINKLNGLPPDNPTHLSSVDEVVDDSITESDLEENVDGESNEVKTESPLTSVSEGAPEDKPRVSEVVYNGRFDSKITVPEEFDNQRFDTLESPSDHRQPFSEFDDFLKAPERKQSRIGRRKENHDGLQHGDVVKLDSTTRPVSNKARIIKK